jgi:hypothetical protein
MEKSLSLAMDAAPMNDPGQSVLFPTPEGQAVAPALQPATSIVQHRHPLGHAERSAVESMGYPSRSENLNHFKDGFTQVHLDWGAVENVNSNSTPELTKGLNGGWNFLSTRRKDGVGFINGTTPNQLDARLLTVVRHKAGDTLAETVKSSAGAASALAFSALAPTDVVSRTANSTLATPSAEVRGVKGATLAYRLAPAQPAATWDPSRLDR